MPSISGVLGAAGHVCIWLSPSREQGIQAGAAAYLSQPTGHVGLGEQALNYAFSGGCNRPSADTPFVLVVRTATQAEQAASACEAPAEADVRLLQSVASTANEQFADYGLPVRIAVGTPAPFNASCTATIPVVACKGGDQSWYGTTDGSIVTPEAGDLRGLTQELAHAMGLAHVKAHLEARDKELVVPGESAPNPIARIQHDLAEYMCEGWQPGAGSLMTDAADCHAAGYLLGPDLRAQERWGSVDLCGIALKTEQGKPEHAQRLADCAERLYEEIAAHAGGRLAGYFVSGLAAQIVERAIVTGVVRGTAPGPHRDRGLMMASLVASLVRVAITTGALGMSVLTAAIVGSGAAVSTALVGSGALGKTVRAAGSAIQDAHLLPLLLGACQGRLWALPSMVAAVCGKATGNIVAALLETLIEGCTHLPPGDREVMRATTLEGRLGHPLACIPTPGPCMRRPRARAAAAGEKLKALDRSLADAVEQLTLPAFHSWLYRADQEVQAARMEEVILRLGEADPPPVGPDLPELPVDVQPREVSSTPEVVGPDNASVNSRNAAWRHGSVSIELGRVQG